MVVFAWWTFIHCGGVHGLALVLKLDRIATVVHQRLGQSNDEIIGFGRVATASWSVQICAIVEGWNRCERAGGEEEKEGK